MPGRPLGAGCPKRRGRCGEGAGPPGTGLPLALHLTEAEQARERGGPGVSSPWSRLCSWRRARRPQDRQGPGCGPSEAGPSCHGAVRSAAPQEGELPLLGSLALFLWVFFFPGLFRAPVAAYGISQAMVASELAGASRQDSHGNTASEPHLCPTPQLVATPAS